MHRVISFGTSQIAALILQSALVCKQATRISGYCHTAFLTDSFMFLQASGTLDISAPECQQS